MSASLPRLLVLCCTAVLLLAASVPRGDSPMRRPVAVAAAQRITLDPVTGQAISPEAAGNVPTTGDAAAGLAALLPREANEVLGRDNRRQLVPVSLPSHARQSELLATGGRGDAAFP